MNTRSMFIAAMVLVSVSLATSPLSAKVALLVGVSKYEHPRLNETPLKYPEDDAKAIAKLLEKSGYKVQLLIGRQATAAAIRTAMSQIAKGGNADSVLLLGFFGHGVQYGESAYYCPYNTDLRVVKNADGQEMRDEGGLLRQEPDPATMISMREMLDALTLSKAGSKLLLADCCREDPSRPRGGLRGRAFGEGLRVSQLPSNSAALFACSAGQQAYEHDEWRHGAFTRAFLDVCENRTEVTANELSALLYRRVNELINGLNNEMIASAKKPALDIKQTVSNVTRDLVDLKLARRQPDKQESKGNVADRRRPPSNPPSSQPSATTSAGGSGMGSSVSTITNSVGIKLVLIKAGSFMMGSPSTEIVRSDDEVRHPVTLTKDYYLGETEVTQGQWKLVMGTEPWWGKPYVKVGENFPATYVSWDDAVEFCKRLSEREGENYRLPTEAEWEYACRGGTSTRYSFGDSASELARFGWFDENAAKQGEQYSHEVKQKLANAFGLYDMHGNVREWCSDWYGEYPSSAVSNPTGPATDSVRVYRGGGWHDDAGACRSANRDYYAPDFRLNYLGFRVAVGR